MMISLYLTILLALPGGPVTGEKKPIWAEEFNYNGLPDSTIWSYDAGDGCPNLCGWGNQEVQHYTVREAANARVEDGKLIIEAIKDQDGRWTSARLKTLGKKHFRYSHVKIRAKLPKGSGTWPALWMLGANIGTAGWPACGEIDIMEHAGKNPGSVFGTLHSPSSFGASENSKSIMVDDFAETFHDYEVKWSKRQITFLVDGKDFYTYRPEKINEKTWPFDEEFFLLINLAMGGGFGSDKQFESSGLRNGIDPALNSARLEVDYIRVYR